MRFKKLLNLFIYIDWTTNYCLTEFCLEIFVYFDMITKEFNVSKEWKESLISEVLHSYKEIIPISKEIIGLALYEFLEQIDDFSIL